MAVFGKKWTKAELDILNTSSDIEELATLLPGRTQVAIKKKLIEQRTWSKAPWSQEELIQFPAEKVVNKVILHSLEDKLSPRTRDEIWVKMKAMGYIWDSGFKEEVSDENPYPDHGKKWAKEELALFPVDRLVTAEILDDIIAKIPRRKPTSIWPKMKKEGYIWQAAEKEEVVTQAQPTLSENEAYVLGIASELGFNKLLAPNINVSSDRTQIADQFDLEDEFTSGELLYAITNRISPFPWDMTPLPEVAKAYRTNKQADRMEAAKALYAKIGKFING